MDSPVSDIAYWFFGPSEDWGESQTRLSNVGNIPSTFTTDSMLRPERLKVTSPHANGD